MKYNKLVRDKIPDIIKQNGDSAVIHRADEKEYIEKLRDKLQEETDEFFKKPSLEEMADILEVLDAVNKVFNIDVDKLQIIKKQKKEKRGGFEQRIILDES